MGVNQSHESTRTAQAIIALALITGNIGRPGTGANSITGQCNAMGSRLFANVGSLLGGHYFNNEAHPAKVAQILGIRDEQIPTEPLVGPLTREAVVIDPIWRTNWPPHQSLDSLLLRLRHPGLGWLTFLLPHHECVGLGEWLSNNANRK